MLPDEWTYGHGDYLPGQPPVAATIVEIANHNSWLLVVHAERTTKSIC